MAVVSLAASPRLKAWVVPATRLSAMARVTQQVFFIFLHLIMWTAVTGHTRRFQCGRRRRVYRILGAAGAAAPVRTPALILGRYFQGEHAMQTTAVTGPQSRFFHSRGLRLHYLDWGNAGAPVLILVHGGLEHARVWDQLARQLSADWQVVVPDLRGHGDSDWSSGGAYAIADMVPDLAAL